MTVNVKSVWRNQRRRLNRLSAAIPSAEDATLIAIMAQCDSIEREFERYGFPDWWTLVHRVRDDAEVRLRFG